MFQIYVQYVSSSNEIDTVDFFDIVQRIPEKVLSFVCLHSLFYLLTCYDKLHKKLYLNKLYNFL